MFGNAITKIMIGLLSYVINNMSDNIRAEVDSFVKRLEGMARKTPNPIDDLFVDLLKAGLEID